VVAIKGRELVGKIPNIRFTGAGFELDLEPVGKWTCGTAWTRRRSLVKHGIILIFRVGVLVVIITYSIV
jgi:hypothetical protein